MANYTVVKVRKETSSDGTHHHIEGVITAAGIHYTRKEVVTSLDAGDTWQTSAGGYTASIQKLSYCPKSACLASPYLKTKPDSTGLDNLENLPAG
ncbi:DUF3892 domain-containing protein [Demequina lutea]|uniref:DUF3892 domain-containing protein n=1 Tax=Demequina lutea TaxID=431489 RepID=A0A7Y9ZB34_9MICO|nr:DUF3892 domain-containing protein [Demequina lutea]NYI40973.1 hypothetical protein [Demequina lutea]